MAVAPDLIEAVEGYRSWTIRIHPSGDPVLASPLRGRPWQAGVPLRAVCAETPWHPPLHPAPAEGCSCGIHAYLAERDALVDAAGSRGLRTVTGPVALWGEVVRHTRGWRAQYAYPSALTVHAATTDGLSYVFTWETGALRTVPAERLARALAGVYDLPVVVSPGDDPLGPLRRDRPEARRLQGIELGIPLDPVPNATGLRGRLARWLAV
jgi:hypothetical protein